MICQSCSEPFEPTSSQQRFCSKTCKNRASNAKIAAARQADPESYRAYKKSLYDRDPDLARKRMRDYRAANPEKMQELERKRHLKDGDKRREQMRASHHRDKERRNAKRRQWFADNHEHSIEQVRKYRIEFPERVKMSSDAAFQRGRVRLPWRQLIKGASERARKKGLPFSLTPEWAEKTWTGVCAVTGIPFRLGLREPGPKTFSPSIDRIVPSLGYIPENCRFVLWAVNAFKYDGTDEDMISIARDIIEFADRSTTT